MTTRGKVLVIDDEPAIVGLFTDYLTQEGFDVVSASGGAEGLERLAVDKPDIVLLDMRMPGMDGIETLRAIRGQNMRVSVMMISGYDDEAAAKEALALGAFDYALKPVDFDYLRRALDKMAPSVVPGIVPGSEQPVLATSPQGLLYDLALDVFRLTRTLPPSAHAVGSTLEAAALTLVYRGAEKAEMVRSLNQIRTLLRFAKDLGDLTDAAHRTIEAQVAKARRSVGLG